MRSFLISLNNIYNFIEIYIMSIIQKIKELPEDLQIKIYEYYYNILYFNEIIHPLEYTLFMMGKINKYITYHAIPHINANFLNVQQHQYYYTLYNEYLEKIYKNFSLNRFLMHSEPCSENIHYFNLILSANILTKIRKKYKYFCAYTIALIANPVYNLRNHQRTLRFFSNLTV